MGRYPLRWVRKLKSRQLWFAEPHRVEIRDRQLPAPGPGQVLIRNLFTGISSGTEMLVYRGQLPGSMALDAGLSAYRNQGAGYPLQYGYAAVGQVEKVGSEVEASLEGRTVFAFQPHASHGLCRAEDVIPVPDDVSPRTAVFLANMETAVNLVLDGNPRLGDRVVLTGQGVVGLLVTSLLARFPLAGLYAVESIERRRDFASAAGAGATFSPGSADELAVLKSILRPEDPGGGADVVFELSGAPDALNLAIDLCGYGSRIVVGSWYGTKPVELDLGGRFHRNRIAIVSSQVSTIDPALSGRWDKSRRFDLAWDMLRKCQPEQFITHSMPLDAAGEAYGMLHQTPEAALQVVFDYQC